MIDEAKIFFESVVQFAGAAYEFCNNFDMRKPLERSFLLGVKCESLVGGAKLMELLDHCRGFLANLSRFLLGLFVKQDNTVVCSWYLYGYEYLTASPTVLDIEPLQ